SKGKVVLRTTRGAFRFVTGTQYHSAYQINTPYGSLGVRGTEFTCEVKPKEEKRSINGCDIKCTVQSGVVESTTSGGNRRTFTAGQSWCQKGNEYSVTSSGGPPPPSSTPGPGGGGCQEEQGTGGCISGSGG